MVRLSGLLSCLVLLPIAFFEEEFEVHGRSIDSGVAHVRNNRAYYNTVSLVRKGAQIVKALLYHSKPTDADNPYSKLFLKRGGINKLKKDFYRFNPTDIRGFPLENGGRGKAAKVADRILIYKSQGDAGVPQLEIYMAKDIDSKKATGKAFSELDREVIRYID